MAPRKKLEDVEVLLNDGYYHPAKCYARGKHFAVTKLTRDGVSQANYHITALAPISLRGFKLIVDEQSVGERGSILPGQAIDAAGLLSKAKGRMQYYDELVDENARYR